MIWLLVVLGSTILPSSQGQQVGLGSCPDLAVKKQFDLNQYLGRWYQRATYGTELFQGKGRCVSADYTLDTDTGKVNVFNQQQPISGFLPTMRSIRGSAVLEEPSKGEGKMLVTFPLPVIGSITSPYWVLDTDYSSWSVVYSCTEIGPFHFTSVWILTRAQTVDSSAERVLEQQLAPALSLTGHSREDLTNTDQVNCQ